VSTPAYRKNLVEIIDGSSTAFVKNKRVFIKHKNVSDVVDYEIIYDNLFERARSKGLPTNEEILEDLDAGEIWTKADEEYINTQKSFIEGLKLSKSSLFLDSAIRSINNQLEEAETDLIIHLSKKNSLVQNSAETYASNRANDYYILGSFFKDKDAREPLYTEEEFEYLDGATLSEVIQRYNEFNGRFAEEQIMELVIQDFYKIYYSFSDTATDFFGKPVAKLTNFQLNLIIYTRIFKNIFEEHQDIPERMKKDPNALLDFASSADSREKARSSLNKENSAGASVIGATKEDMNVLGLNTDTQKSMNQAVKDKGGSLSMKDLMDLNGI
jgi:hypothetical protein